MIKESILKLLRIYYKARVVKRVGSFHEPLNVNHFTTVTKYTYLGTNCHFNGMKIVGCGKVEIGDNFHSGEGCLLITQNHNYNGKALPYDETYKCKDIVIEDNVWIGSRVIILGGVKIGEGAIIQAGTVVSQNIEKYAIAGGNPAQPFKYRDISHYKKLQKERKFH